VLAALGCAGFGLLAVGAPPANAGGCEGAAFSPEDPPGACWRPFSPESPFNRPLPAEPAQPLDSVLLGAALGGRFGPAPLLEVGQADTPDDFGRPIYFNTPHNPVFKIRCTQFGGRCPVAGHRIRIPPKARPSGGSDAHMAIIDREAGWEYDFFAVEGKSGGSPGRITAGWAGRTPIGGEGSKGLDAGATASGFALSAGIIRPAELRAGEIDHALFIGVPCTNGTAVWPAQNNPGRSCSVTSRLGAPAMGQHFYLAMSSAEIARLGLPRWQTTILRAMADYGMFVGDTGGNTWGIALESGTAYTSFGAPDPWVKIARRSAIPPFAHPDGTTRYLFDMRYLIDWETRLRVAAPCVSRGKC
jgi:hypothetical protein